ncbi:MAG: NADH-quinone oxidoreductase subunit L, partial [Gemmatimonadaceae bacterium]|nr:NADH-quinone oxidoreductase subunit L [Acetobacteraceae bacterium]
NTVLADMHHLPAFVGLLPTVVGVLGIALAYVMYVARPELPERMRAAAPGLHQFVLEKWRFDELYDAVFVRPTGWSARTLWQVGDAKLIDGIPNGIASLTADGSAQVVRIQTGSIAVYAFTMLIGLVLLVSVFLLFR